MQSTARLYHCCRCQQQVIICTRCDRGQRYCPGQCAAAARSSSLKRAAKKYQSTRTGRFNNAARQRRYRERQKQKVTHQGSSLDKPHDVLEDEFSESEKAKKQDQSDANLICHHCGAVCSAFLRLDFLQRSRGLPSFRRSMRFGRDNGNR